MIYWSMVSKVSSPRRWVWKNYDLKHRLQTKSNALTDSKIHYP